MSIALAMCSRSRRRRRGRFRSRASRRQPPAPAPPAAPQPPSTGADRGPDRGDAGRPDLSECAVHHVVRRRPRPAVLPVRRRRAVCRIVTYYRTALKQKGDVLFESPPTHQFEIGRFRDETMAFPPSVTIKDYTWGGSAGLSESEARAPAAALPDGHSDRPRAARHLRDVGCVTATDRSKRSSTLDSCSDARRRVTADHVDLALPSGTPPTSRSIPCCAICRTCCVSSMLQNFGPHIEQKCATLAPSAGSVSSW